MPNAPTAQRFLVTQFHFDDMRLHVGDRFQLETHGPGASRHYSTVIGYVPGQSVLIKTPFVGGVPAPYTDGQPLTARAFTGRGLFAFDTTVERVCISPFHYLHLAFPTEVRGAQIRNTERVRVYMPTEITFSGHAPVPGMITDLGINGAAVECNQSFPEQAPLTVHIRFSLEDIHLTAAFEAQAVVHKKTESPKTNQASPVFSYGVEFTDLTLGQTVLLQNFVYHQLLTHRHIVI